MRTSPHREDVKLVPEVPEVYRPSAGATVKVSTYPASQTAGTICVRGNALDGTTEPTSVSCGVYQSASEADAATTPGLNSETATLNPGENPNFEMDSLDGALCNAGGTQDNWLVVWAFFPGTMMPERTIVYFKGKANDGEDCS